MKEKAANDPTGLSPSGENPEITPLVAELRGLIHSARHAVATRVNTLQVLTNFEIGRRIVEHEQQGAERAEYGKSLLKELSARLTEEFGTGFSLTNLKLMRQFFIEYQNRIGQALPDPFTFQKTGQTATDQLMGVGHIPEQAVISEKLLWKSPFTLSWTHYVLLLTVKNPDERSFYEIEAFQSDWSLRELKRQISSGLYERLALSRDKEGLRRLANEGQVIVKPEDLLKEPYVLEFLGLDEKSEYSESDLESAIIDRLEQFLLELGKGFLFEARQKRFTFDEDHFFVDLVFYNRLLRCYVLIDLKLDKLNHQDLGQMQMYVNYFDRQVKTPEENPTIGVLLCKRKKDAIVELTLPADANIHAREYQLYLPSKELLRQKLMDWAREEAQ
ncbi:PDDEXK nuclease domain-containing protein [Desulfuromonas acetexigens]|uniref:PDDEXK nuclease domain-containing protein n=1 Tax=Trichloromonas acetexigens TaxID=38815 RepID=UPI001F0F657D|nr:PDDEXK nuclease domain-containing protein [Desulfuromonas acetexigens]